ncbi:MAG: TlyA family RNA methyltransferase [Deltaproteobacteria bacterium]|nr:TlyA family RNA methyltransferase [Deltaproteobacteria bacterium]MBW1953502.1 TlyA family RNA methyltransferase [Deltaproteobacteria bacterium]MBW1987212.1 TlyA family RNA methyltransferase [Deltaproteobacteria bacterium]MBW2134308.1 TlyA family RNA methyltransferase [Deltaproteobacteria bacterium]
MVERGLAPSRDRAQALILAGKVLVAGVPVTKAGALVSAQDSLTLESPDIPYVSRGGVKLAAALEHFQISVTGKVVLDVGASTGGFTDCLLQRGALRVYAVDVGYGQLAWSLRQDARVILLERTNIRYLPPEAIAEPIDLATIDVSFISLKLVLPRVKEFVRPGGEIIALAKPQFEVGREQVGKGGVVRDQGLQLQVVDDLKALATSLDLEVIGHLPSPILGPKGNQEYLLYFRRI